jgi:porin
MSINGPLFAFVESGYQRNQLKGDNGLRGNYKAGVWYDGSAFPDFTTKVLGPAASELGIASRVEHGNYGFYGLFDQGLIRFGEPGEDILRGLGETACVQAAPDDSQSELPFFFTTGIVARGIWASRPRDVAGFGIVYGQFSSYLRSAERFAHRLNPAVGVQDQETVLEWTYLFRFRNGAFFFQPDIQYIIRPSGTGHIPDALAVGTPGRYQLLSGPAAEKTRSSCLFRGRSSRRPGSFPTTPSTFRPSRIVRHGPFRSLTGT